MCIILTLAQKVKNKETQADFNRVVDIGKAYNSDGIGLIAFNKTGVVHSFRDMVKPSQSLEQVIAKYSNTLVHLRLATAGDKTADNVHFWQWNNWYFAHNGIVGQLTAGKAKSDSLQFFEAICQKGLLQKNGLLNHKGIEKLSNKYNLSGRFVLFNSILRVGYYFGNWYAYKLQNSLVISSQSISLVEATPFFGFTFTTPRPTIKEKEIPSSIFMVDFINATSHEIQPTFGRVYSGYDSIYGMGYGKERKLYDDDDSDYLKSPWLKY